MKAIPLLLLVFLFGCGTEPEKATRILEQQGYTHIVITGWRPFACDDQDNFATGFKAVNVQGHEVTGVVCDGIFKNATIRFD